MNSIKNLGKYAIKGATSWNKGKIKDKEFILNNYKNLSNDEIGNQLGISREAVRKRLKRIRVHRTSEEIKNNYISNKHKMVHYGKDHPLFGKHRSNEVKEKISKKLKYRIDKYYRPEKRIKINGKWKTKRLSHLVWCSQPYNLPYIPKGFVVHHIDFDEKNNSPDNLLLMDNSDHNKFHSEASNLIRSQL